MSPSDDYCNRILDEKLSKDFKDMQNAFYKLYSTYFNECKRYDDVNEENIYKSSVFMIDMVLQCVLT